MSKELWIKDLIDGSSVKLCGFISNVTQGVTTPNTKTNQPGKKYLSITLSDKTGSIEAKKWDASKEDIDFFTVGRYVVVMGEVNLYRTSLQLKIVSFEQLPEEQIEREDYFMSAPESLESMEEDLKRFFQMIQDPECKAFLDYFYRRDAKIYEKFMMHPAAVRNHHEYYHGLIYHTLCCARICEMCAELYPSVDKDLLLTGALLHDIGKMEELNPVDNPGYSDQGKLLGHISMMGNWIHEAKEKLVAEGKIAPDSEVPLLLEHMILSHHGKHEFGSPVLPMTREAILLNMADDMDAKMNIIDKALATIQPGKFTGKIFPLDERILYRSKREK